MDKTRSRSRISGEQEQETTPTFSMHISSQDLASHSNEEWSPSLPSSCVVNRDRTRNSSVCSLDPIVPPLTPSETPKFTWGDRDAPTVMKTLSDIFLEVVHWRKNCFMVPFGKQGKLFVLELARLFRAFGEDDALEPVALKAAFVALILMLQKPHSKSKNADHNTCLKRRLELWMNRQFEEVLDEGRTLQQRLKKVGGRPIR